MKRYALLCAAFLVAAAAAFGQGAAAAGDPASMTAAELRAAKGSGGKVLYTTLEDAQKLARKGPVVLFFAADWCPTCIAAMKDINARGAALKGITVVVADYDKERDLKSRYGVRAQHTFVRIDAGGTLVHAWNGGGVDEIVRRVLGS